MASPKIKLKLRVDADANKVVFAEADKDFIDFLIHILSLPLVTAVRLLKEKTMDVGSLGHLYESLQNFPDFYFQIQPNQNKNTLVNPRPPICAPGISTLMLSDDNPRGSAINTRKSYYTCVSCYSHVADVPKLNCPQCGLRQMNRELTYVLPEWRDGFLKGLVTYVVMDNLEFMPMSSKMFVSLLNNFDVKDVSALEEIEIKFDTEEGLKLLKLSLECKTVLTSFYHDIRSDFIIFED
ncbi:hypothetical protein ACOSP7_032663 [Xanthoceras sorbifolium]|uniref:Uncharacterized protein n=1 Tax=Xanthoceras sorbifolium TaxID=99658 RepID=A0ABQ8GZL3_9ROSI|nr:hypothetical protein JRO89_XSUnG0078500 [Xanthoceras sorbifolium]